MTQTLPSCSSVQAIQQEYRTVDRRSWAVWTTAQQGDKPAKEWVLPTSLQCQTVSQMRNSAWETAGSRGTLQPVPPTRQSARQIPHTSWRTEIPCFSFLSNTCVNVCFTSLTQLWWKLNTGSGYLCSLVTQPVVHAWTRFGSWYFAERSLWLFPLPARYCPGSLSLQFWAGPTQKFILQHFPSSLFQSHAVNLPLPAPLIPMLFHIAYGKLPICVNTQPPGKTLSKVQLPEG